MSVLASIITPSQLESQEGITKRLPKPKNRKERKMESTNSFTEEELARKLERVFQFFALAQEDWAMAHDPSKSTDDTEEDAAVSA
jgi:hypothetical protein